MNKKTKNDKWYNAFYIVRMVSMVLLAITLAIVLISAFDKNSEGEASIGAFKTISFNDGWTLNLNGIETSIQLPERVACKSGDVLVLTNHLPEGLADGMSFMMRASMEDMKIYVDGELRESYTSDGIENMSFYIPSANVVVELNAEDGAKDIKIEITVKTDGFLNEATIAYGNDVWFPVFRDNVVVNFAAFFVFILGFVLIITTLFLRNTMGDTAAARYLGLLMIDIALWVLSESNLRQFIFQRPSLSQYYSFFTMELMGAFALMYFDEVQHKVFHKPYVIAEGIIVGQMMINIFLHFTGICDFYNTLIFSHIMIGVGIAMIIAFLIRDIIKKRVKTYRATAFGMICFMIMAIIELAGFYITRFRVLGTFVCIGLVLLMIFTIIQAMEDIIVSSKEREKKQMQMSNNTLETIASALDARDEYTGGHSERVGMYAGRLAREMAADYDLSEEDILRIQYIGLVHDIGKIGVADSVLNKAGRLTDEEFSLMKKHTDIGYEIMGATGEIIEGLLDGIRYHHERFDGKGYPEGLSDTDIPLVARILCIADCYDAMTSNRVYRKRLTDEEVRGELLRCAGTQFDPALTEIFVKLIDKGELRVSTVNGMGTNQNGKVMLSAKLENRLQNDLLDNKDVIKNPTHIRMLCYVMKLMEKKGRNVTLYFFGPKPSSGRSEEQTDELWKKLNEAVKGHLDSFDTMLRYNSTLNVLAVFDQDENENAVMINSIKELCPEILIERVE